jgi:hypothetical protein
MTIHDLEATCWEFNQDAAGSKKSPNKTLRQHECKDEPFMVKLVMYDESTCWTVFHRHFVMTDHSGWAVSKITHTFTYCSEAKCSHP